MSAKKPTTKHKSKLHRFAAALGPGLITGAADDDPSGIATYSIAGAQYGLSFLWMAWVSWPLMGFVQMMCARIGMVTGRGLAGVFREKYPRWLIIIFCIALFIANAINVGADLAGMGDAAGILTGTGSHVWVFAFGIGISIAIIRFRYYQIAMVLKWLALVLLAYIVTGFLIHPDWSQVAHATFAFHVPHGGWGMVVAILGTTISPYLFFWQSAQEVEEDKSKGRRMLIEREGATKDELLDRMLDVGSGTFLSNIVMFFIILTTGLTLHAHGITSIQSSKEAAEALKPLAGSAAMMLYTVGLIGVGLLAIPTLAGSSAYAFAETLDWKEGLDEKLMQARAFYAVIVISVACGIGIDLSGINPMKALYYSAVVNGLIAPFIMVGILLVARDKRIMNHQASPLLSQGIVALTTLLMFGAALGMFVT